MFNPSPFPAHPELLSLEDVDVFIVNEAEATQLTGAPEGTAPATLLEHLHTKFPSADLVVTAGELGSIALLSGTQYAQEAFPVTVIDTTGAGDACVGALAAALALGKPFVEAVADGMRAGATAILSPGAASSYGALPTVTRD